MKIKEVVLFVCLLIAAGACAQDNFIVTPEKPQPGQEIQFTYRSSSVLGTLKELPKAYIIIFGSNEPEAKDILLKKNGDEYIGTVKTDTSMRLLVFAFANGDIKDNNEGNGYLVPFYIGDSIRRGAYSDIAMFYGGYGNSKFDIKNNWERVKTFYEKEIALYPENTGSFYTDYLRIAYFLNKEKGAPMVLAALEKQFAAGLNTKEDYKKVCELYNLMKLNNQQQYFMNEMLERFPGSQQSFMDTFYNKFITIVDPVKKEKLARQAMVDVERDSSFVEKQELLSALRVVVAISYLMANDRNNFLRLAAEVKEPDAKMELYNSAVMSILQDTGSVGKRLLPYAAEMAKEATGYARKEIIKPTQEKPRFLLGSEWLQKRKDKYASYASTYAQVLYVLGNYKAGLSLAREAAFVYNNWQESNMNEIWAILAEKVLPAKEYKPQVEQFVIDQKGSKEIRNVLKRTYVKIHGSEENYEQYLAVLDTKLKEQMLEDIKGKKVNIPAPDFTLNDLSGKEIKLQDYKGKIVVLDFWATWCGPCVASFPAMQKLANKYEHNPNVAFLFINTGEQVENKKSHVKNFLSKGGFDLPVVLLDNNNEAAKDFGITGLPAKIVVGSDGHIKFQATGYSSDEHLIYELESMIKLVK